MSCAQEYNTGDWMTPKKKSIPSSTFNHADAIDACITPLGKQRYNLALWLFLSKGYQIAKLFGIVAWKEFWKRQSFVRLCGEESH